MAFLKPNEFYDPFRKKWVRSKEEELIRQAILKEMVDNLGYPAAYITIEKELSSLPHLTSEERKTAPKRRIDILAFSKRDNSLVPLLLIECKAIPLSIELANQVIGYNEVVRAPFVAIANGQQILVGRYEEGGFRFSEGLLRYSDLQARLV